MPHSDEISKAEERPQAYDLSVIGTSGLKQYDGRIDEEFLPKLKGDYGPMVYREMSDNNSAVGSIRYVIRALARQVQWRVEPASTEQESIDWAEFLESCLLDMEETFEDFISEVLSFLDYGWSFFEIVYKLRKGDTANKSTRSQFEDGKLGWRKLALRAQDTRESWEFDPEDCELLGMNQVDNIKGVEAFIPTEKAILFRTDTYKDNPEGRSIWRNAVIDYFFLKRISIIEAIGIERDMTGLLTMEVPLELLIADATPTNKQLRGQLETMLAELKNDERAYAIVPPEMDKQGQPTGYKLKLLASGGNRQVDTDKAKRYYKINILQSVAAQFIELGMQGVGSLALASSHTDLFGVALGAYLDIMAATFNRSAVYKLMKLNGAPREFWPELVHGDLESQSLAEMGTYIQALASSGQLPTDDAIQRKLLELAKLPMPDLDENIDEDEEIEVPEVPEEGSEETTEEELEAEAEAAANEAAQKEGVKKKYGLVPRYHQCSKHGGVRKVR